MATNSTSGTSAVYDAAKERLEQERMSRRHKDEQVNDLKKQDERLAAQRQTIMHGTSLVLQDLQREREKIQEQLRDLGASSDPDNPPAPAPLPTPDPTDPSPAPGTDPADPPAPDPHPTPNPAPQQDDHSFDHDEAVRRYEQDLALPHALAVAMADQDAAMATKADRSEVQAVADDVGKIKRELGLDENGHVSLWKLATRRSNS